MSVNDSQTVTPPQQRRMSTRRIVLVGLAGLVVLVGGGSAVMSVTTKQAQLDRNHATTSALMAQLQSQDTQQAKVVSTSVQEGLGIDTARVSRDKAEITKMAQTALTWKSGVEYSQARTSLKREYHLTETDPFLKDFMPPAAYNKDSSGKRFYAIDADHLSSEVNANSLTVDVVRVNATEYTYVAFVDVTATSTIGDRQRQVTTPVMFTVTTKIAGVVSSLSAITSSGQTRHSA